MANPTHAPGISNGGATKHISITRFGFALWTLRYDRKHAAPGHVLDIATGRVLAVAFTAVDWAVLIAVVLMTVAMATTPGMSTHTRIGVAVAGGGVAFALVVAGLRARHKRTSRAI